MRLPQKLSDAEIEWHSMKLLTDLGGGQLPSLPIPVQRIVEAYLGLELLFGDPIEYGLASDTLGAIYFDDRLVFVNKMLAEHDTLEGRLNFTLGHEIGHERLHQGVVDPMAYIRPRLHGGRVGKYIMCRSGDPSPIERQADEFSAALLMPRTLLQAVVPTIALKQGICHENGHYVYSHHEEDAFVGALTDVFSVSKKAMKRRLRDLDLAVEGAPGQLRWF